jgi:hypothetical protein
MVIIHVNMMECLLQHVKSFVLQLSRIIWQELPEPRKETYGGGVERVQVQRMVDMSRMLHRASCR